jgi:hypothetical protein
LEEDFTAVAREFCGVLWSSVSLFPANAMVEVWLFQNCTMYTANNVLATGEVVITHQGYEHLWYQHFYVCSGIDIFMCAVDKDLACHFDVLTSASCLMPP